MGLPCVLAACRKHCAASIPTGKEQLNPCPACVSSNHCRRTSMAASSALHVVWKLVWVA